MDFSSITETSMPESSASPEMIKDYQAWRAMGPGGVPATWSGYLINVNADRNLAFEDTISPDMYRKPEKYCKAWSTASEAEKAAAQTSFLKGTLPHRAEPRSRALKFVLPQREKNADHALDPETKHAYETAFTELGTANASATEWKTSMLEKQGRALFLQSSHTSNSLVSATQGEICHIHGSDSSAHVILSFADAEEVIAKGWGERHRLSGTEWVPLGYTLVYVPRGSEEIGVCIKIFQAGVDFMSSS